MGLLIIYARGRGREDAHAHARALPVPITFFAPSAPRKCPPKDWRRILAREERSDANRYRQEEEQRITVLPLAPEWGAGVRRIPLLAVAPGRWRVSFQTSRLVRAQAHSSEVVHTRAVCVRGIGRECADMRGAWNRNALWCRIHRK